MDDGGRRQFLSNCHFLRPGTAPSRLINPRWGLKAVLEGPLRAHVRHSVKLVVCVADLRIETGPCATESRTATVGGMQGVTEVCGECEFDPRAVDDDELGPELVRLATGYEKVISDASDDGCPALSSRPSPGVWSILEYVGHVEFIVNFVPHMCEVVKEDELAATNGVDPDEHVDESNFNNIVAAEMAGRIRSAGDRANAALDGVEPGALDWMLRFNGNPAPLRLLTVAMVHETHHHLRDVSVLASA